MSVLGNQTNVTAGDAFFWRVGADIITAREFSSDTVATNTISTGSLIVGGISTTGSIVVAGNLTATGDINALNVTATDTLTSYFTNTQYITSYQGANIHSLLLADQIQGSNLVQFPYAILSSISTTSITLDGNTLDTAGQGFGAQLLLNGQPIATASSLTSSILTWSFYPAINNVDMNNFSLTGAGNVEGDNAFFYDGTFQNQIVVPKVFATTLDSDQISTLQISTNTLRANSLRANTLNTSTISNVGTLTSQQADVTTLNTTSITTATLTTTAGGTVGGTNGSFGNLTVTASANFSGSRPNFTTGINSSGANNFNNQSLDNCPNINTQGNTNMTIASANAMDLTAPTRIQLICDGGNDFGSVKPVNIIGRNGNRGQVNITAQPGYVNVGTQIQGEVNIVANGGGGVTAYATGGLINITANTGSSPILGTLTYSAIKLNAAGITSYAGFASPLVAVPGYNLIQASLGIELIAGSIPVIPNVPGTIYLYGATGIPQQTGGIRAQNGLGIDFIVPYPQGFITPPYDLIISGNPAGQKVTLSNVRTLQSDGGTASGFTSMTTSNFQASNVIMFGDGANNGNILGLSGLEKLLNFSNVSTLNVQAGLGTFATLVSQRVSTQSLFISTINGLPFSAIIAPTIPSTFSDLTTNLLQANTISTNSLGAFTIANVSSINGFSIAQLVSSVSPPTPAPSTFLDLYTSSFVANTIQTSNISTVSMQAQGITGVSTINGFTIAQFVSSVSPQAPAPSTFTQLFTSSLVADSITGASFSPGLKLLGNGVTIQPTLDNSITLTTTGVGLVTIVSQEEMQVFTPSTIIFGDLRPTTINGLPPITSIPTNYPQLTVSSLTASNVSTTVLNAGQILLNGVALSPLVSSFNTLQANTISTGILTISTINGYNVNQLVNQPVISTFSNIYVSDAGILNQTSLVINVSSINGFNTNQFLSTAGDLQVVSTFNQFFTSSLGANTVSTTTLNASNINATSVVSGSATLSSINGFNINQLVNPAISTVSTFQQLFTSSLVGSNIQTINLSTLNVNAFTLNNVSSINTFSIAQLVSSVSPQPPVPSTVVQFFTSSLAVNGIANYQYPFLDISAPGIITLESQTGVNIIGDQCNVTITSSNIIENAFANFTNNTGQNYAVTAGCNMNLNSSNTLSIYNTNTAPPVGCNDLYIIGQGNTTLAGQNNLNLSGVLDVNITGTSLYAQTSAVQFQVPTGSFAVNATNMPLVGTTRINLNTNSNINLLSLSSITTSAVSTINTVPATWFSGDIRATTFNGLPLPTGGGSVTSTFNQLYAYQLSNNPTIGSGAMGILASAQIDMASPTIQANASDYLLFASNSFVQSSNTRLQGSNTVSIYNGALPTVAAGGISIQAINNLNLSSVNVLANASNNIQFLTPSTICSGDIRANTFNGLPLPTGGGGNVTSTFTQLNTNILSNNPDISNDLKIRAANAIVLNDTGETTVSLGVSLVVSGLATGTVDIQTAELNSLNNFIELTAFNTLDLLSLSSLTVTGQSSINLTSSNINLFTPSTICSGDIRAVTFNGLPLPTSGGGGSVVSTYTQLNTNILSNNPAIGNDLLLRASNAIVMTTPLGATSISLGASLDVMGASGATNIYSQEFNTLNSNIGFTAYNTIALLGQSNISITGQSTINLTSSNILLQGAVNMCNNNINNIFQLNFSNSANIDGTYANQLNFNASNSYFLGNLRFYGSGRTLDIADNQIYACSYLYGSTGGFLTINAGVGMVIENNQGARQALNSDGSFEFRTTGANKIVYMNTDEINFNGSSNNKITNISSINGNASLAINATTINVGGAVNANCNAISNVGTFSRYLISTELPQPVIQYAYVSTTGATSGTVTITLPQRYTSVTSYIPFAVVQNDVTTTFYVSTITRATFEIGWDGYTGFGDIIFSWNTMGT